MGAIEWLVYRRKFRVVREFLLVIANLDIPDKVSIGKGLVLHHRGMGTVIHPNTDIEDGVTIYHQVTIGRKDAHIPWLSSPMESIRIGRDAVLYPGCKVLGGSGVTVIGEGAIVAANAVVSCSIGEYEIWAGIPARKVGDRSRISA